MADLTTFIVRSTQPQASKAPVALWAFVLLGIAVCAFPKNSNDIRWGGLGYTRTIALALMCVLAILHSEPVVEVHLLRILTMAHQTPQQNLTAPRVHHVGPPAAGAD